MRPPPGFGGSRFGRHRRRPWAGEQWREQEALPGGSKVPLGKQVPVPLSHCPSPAAWRAGHRQECGGRGRRAQRNSPGSGMPGIQVTRRLEINGSSQEPRTASLPRQRKRLQAGQPRAPPLPAPRNQPVTSFLWQSLAPFCPFPATRPLRTRSEETPQGYPHSPALTTILSLPEIFSHLLLPPAHPQPSALQCCTPPFPWGPPCPGLSPA